MAIEDLAYLSLKDIRVEFNKIINYYEDSKSLNSSDLSVNPINVLRLNNWSSKKDELFEQQNAVSTKINFDLPHISFPVFMDEKLNAQILKAQQVRQQQ